MQTFEFETLTVNSSGEILSRALGQARSIVETLKNDIALEMVWLPGGITQMGSPGHLGYADEHPQHPVSVAPFFISRYLVTQEQWLSVMRRPLNCRFSGARLPVDRASWDDAQSFCQRLAKRSGHPYRLPSEIEWEYACRANTATPFSCGETLTTDLANYVGEHIFANEPKGIYRHGTTPVDTFPPNAFGLSDMHGNLWEWCADAWHDDYTAAPFNGTAWDDFKPKFRVVRGGSWHETPNHCRSAVRLKFAPTERDDFVGFRVALTLPES
jgi:formylglycine-generating enzyme required for sulfatase activity